MIDELLTQEVQLGFDIATSVTIIGALASWFWESRRRAAKERRLGINEQARVVSLEKVQTILSEFETSFNDLVQACARFEGPIRRRINADSETPLARLESYVESRPEVIDQLTEQLQTIRSGVDVYYESIQKRRYSLVPVLDSLPGGDAFLEALSKDITEIGQAHDSINSGYVALLKEFHAMVGASNEIIEQADLAEDCEAEDKIRALLNERSFIRRANMLLGDADYDSWIISFVPTESENEFRERRDNNTLGENTDLLFKVCINIAGSLVRRPSKLYAQILWMASREVKTTRVECKDILIKLSALTHKLLANNDDIELSKVIALYESDKYFGRDSSQR
ncbi:hypothetical protein [uncultured Ferrimonas sp.]|uniref:hypothetical protein n=1 Tax=uncultured Ferrimonas sp. TaxID=432640 RepID=UPI00262F7590|nr:hypothetical protein [uncultured Ferrimonas sp.]